MEGEQETLQTPPAEVTPEVTPEPVPAPAPAPEPSPEPTPEPQDSNEVVSAERADGAGSFVLVEDPVTHKRTLQQREAAPAEPEPAKPEEHPNPTGEHWDNKGEGESAVIEQKNEELNGEVEPYDIDSLAMAVATGNVDPRRVPAEYRKQYEDYRINQAIDYYNQQQKQAEDQRAAAAAMAAEKAKQNPEARKEFYNNLENAARERALKDIGMSAEEYDKIAFDEDADQNVIQQYETARMWHRNNLMNSIQNVARTQEMQRRVYEDRYKRIAEFTTQARKDEKNFDVIDRAMLTRYKSLPYEQGQVTAEALKALQAGTISEAQMDVLYKYYEDTRKEFYAKKNGLQAGTPTPQPKPTPPTVETAGTGRELPPEPKFRPSDLRSAKTIRERREILEQILANRNR